MKKYVSIAPLHGDYLAHHGVKGQKWGIRRYQNPDGTLTEAGKKRYYNQFHTNYGHDFYKDTEKFNKWFDIRKSFLEENLYENPKEYVKAVNRYCDDHVKKGYWTKKEAEENKKYYLEPKNGNVREDVGEYWLKTNPLMHTVLKMAFIDLYNNHLNEQKMIDIRANMVIEEQLRNIRDLQQFTQNSMTEAHRFNQQAINDMNRFMQSNSAITSQMHNTFGF